MRLGWLAGSISALAVLAILVVYAGSELTLARRYPGHPERLVRPSPQAIADAPRQARLLGCPACHGPGLRGNAMYEETGIGSITAPNLPLLIRDRTDGQIAAAIRQGRAPDGRGLLVMPAGLFSRLGDEEVAALIAWIRGLPAAGPRPPPTRLTMRGRLAVLIGDLPLQPELIARYRDNPPAGAGAEHEAGRRIAALVCAECHAPDLSGGDRPHADFNDSVGRTSPPSPDLTIAGAYDRAAFTRLLRTGVAPGERELGLMSEVAREDLRFFTDAEIAALFDYLQARAGR
jgi:cytochrome c553